MDIRISKINESSRLCDTAIIPFTEGIKLDEKLLYLDSDVEAMISHLLRSHVFSGKKDQVEAFRLARDNNPRNVILVGLGKEEDVSTGTIRSAISAGVQQAKKFQSKAIEIHPVCSDCPDNEDVTITQMTKYAILASYTFNDYKAPKEEDVELEEINILIGPVTEVAKAEEALNKGIMEGHAISLARNLVNEPANIMTPKVLAEAVEMYGKEYGFEVKVLEEKQIEALGMEAFLNVGKGSIHPPRLITMTYMGNPESSEIYGLIGKGLTFDSGGYSIKPTEGMLTMKSDMGGAAAVIGAMTLIAKNKPKVNVKAVIASCENMISGGAYKPGDIIGSMAGKYIEIDNTDAEGRLTLADAVTYAIQKEKVTKIIDIATLTGAVIIALGNDVTGCVSNNDEMFEGIQKAAEASGDKVWRLPAEEEYVKLLKSEVADLKNTGGRSAGTITAALFIKEFTENIPWLHLDIAGTSWTAKAKPDSPVGGTGVGASMLYHFIKNCE